MKKKKLWSFSLFNTDFKNHKKVYKHLMNKNKDKTKPQLNLSFFKFIWLTLIVNKLEIIIFPGKQLIPNATLIIRKHSDKMEIAYHEFSKDIEALKSIKSFTDTELSKIALYGASYIYVKLYENCPSRIIFEEYLGFKRDRNSLYKSLTTNSHIIKLYKEFNHEESI